MKATYGPWDGSKRKVTYGQPRSERKVKSHTKIAEQCLDFMLIDEIDKVIPQSFI